MTIDRFFTKTATVLRFVSTTVDGDFVQQETEIGSISGHLQQASPELAVEIGMSITKTFAFWCALGVDVAEGDKLRINGAQYGVRAVMVNDASPSNPHTELILEKLEGVYVGS